MNMYGGGRGRKDTLSSMLDTNQIMVNIERGRNSILSLLIWRPGDNTKRNRLKCGKR